MFGNKIRTAIIALVASASFAGAAVATPTIAAAEPATIGQISKGSWIEINTNGTEWECERVEWAFLGQHYWSEVCKRIN